MTADPRQWITPDNLYTWWREANRFIGFWGPTAGFSGLVAPMGILGGLLSLVILAGTAVAGLATFLVATLMLYLMLTEVFGISIDLVFA